MNAAISIKSLYNDFNKPGEYSLEYAIEFFDRNAMYLENAQAMQEENDLSLYTQLLWQHLHTLYQKRKFAETVDKATKYLNIIDHETKKTTFPVNKDDWFYGIMLFKGMSLYNLGKFKASTPIFRQLVGHDSKNVNYKNWLRSSLYRQRKWVSNSIVIICGLLLFIEFFFEKLIPSFNVRLSLDIMAFVGLLGSIAYDYFIKQTFKNMKQQSDIGII